jgi:GAF domain-containing protein
LIRGDDPFTAAYDGQMALDADKLQHERDYGPCVDAGRPGLTFLIDDMRTEQRWPDYARHAVERGVGSSLSVPLPFQAATIGALDNYSTRPRAFAEDDVAVGEEVASWVALSVATASAAAAAANEADR